MKKPSNIGVYVAYTVIGIVAFIFIGTLTIKPKPAK